MAGADKKAGLCRKTALVPDNMRIMYIMLNRLSLSESSGPAEAHF